MRPREAYLFSQLKLGFRVRHPGRLISVRKREEVGALMSFTVVRAVRGSDLSSPSPSEGLRRVSLLPPPPTRAPAAMDLPYADEVLHLEVSDFPKTVPGNLE